MYDGLFTRMQWDLVDYVLHQDMYNREHGIVPEVSTAPIQEPENIVLGSGRPRPLSEGYVKEIRAGKYLERRVSDRSNEGASYITKLPHERLWDGTLLKPYVRNEDIYLDDNGERVVDPKDVRFMRTNESRYANPRQVRKSCEAFKWLIRANERKIRLFVTLTYAHNMTDTRVLYQDYRKFWMRLKNEYPCLTGYLVAFEPQKRGAWHAHMLLLSNNANLYIPNKKMHAIWGKGFTKTQTPKGKRDIASYLTSYLTNVREGKVTKKGARLYMYKAGFHFLRHSKNIQYASTERWFGKFDRLDGISDFELLYDYENVRKGVDGTYQLTKILCIEDKDIVKWYPCPPPA
ncbi:MAG: hypothetical protein SPL21_12040 [Fibrobacter sp.]|nr:hypothetical protein [Fibrobacter sp.]